MNKTKNYIIKRYLLMHGANMNSFKMVNKYHRVFQTYDILGRRNIIDKIINKINNFNGICYVYNGLENQKHLGDSVLIDYLTIYWDNSLTPKRLKKIQKIKSKIIS